MTNNEIYGIVKYDGYLVGDRLLEDVIIEVEMLRDGGGGLAIGAMDVAEESKDYTSTFKMEEYFKLTERNLTNILNHLEKLSKEKGFKNLIEYIEAEGVKYNTPPLEIFDEV